MLSKTIFKQSLIRSAFKFNGSISFVQRFFACTQKAYSNENIDYSGFVTLKDSKHYLPPNAAWKVCDRNLNTKKYKYMLTDYEPFWKSTKKSIHRWIIQLARYVH